MRVSLSSDFRCGRKAQTHEQNPTDATGKPRQGREISELGLPADAADRAEVDHGVGCVAVELRTAGAALRSAGVAVRTAGVAVRRIALHHRLLLLLLLG